MYLQSRMHTKIYVILCCLLLVGCGSYLEKNLPTEFLDADTVWNRYKQYASLHEKERTPYRIQGSLLYRSDSKMRRASIVIWSNGDFPLRLDARAGIGTVVARIRESQGEMVIYSPMEKNAVFYRNIESVFLDLHTPLPFGLYTLVALIRGQFYSAFGKIKGLSPCYMSNGNILYTLSGGNISGVLELLPSGLPIRLEDTIGWVLEIQYDYTTWLPNKIIISHEKENKVILRVNGYEVLSQAFTETQLQLEIPEGVSLQFIQ